MLSQSAVDDPVDKQRVACVLTSLLHAERGADVSGSTTPLAPSAVRVGHAVRFVEPSRGIEIVVRVSLGVDCVDHQRVLATARSFPHVALRGRQNCCQARRLTT